jgi:FkbM family methyltransferase
MDYLAKYLSLKSPIDYELGQIFSKEDPIVIFDIGACEAEDSIRYALKYPNATIHSFEPLPSNLKIIRDNLDKTGLSHRIHLHEEALSDKKGIATFHVSNSSQGVHANKSSSLLEPKEHLVFYEYVDFNEKMEVKTITLHDFSQSHQITKIDFIHMDVQGAELNVLLGAADMIHAVKAVWLEVSPHEIYKGQALDKDIYTFMMKKGFFLVKNNVFHKYGEQLYLRKDEFDLVLLYRLKIRSFFRFYSEKIARKFKKMLKLS